MTAVRALVFGCASFMGLISLCAGATNDRGLAILGAGITGFLVFVAGLNVFAGLLP